MGSRMTIRSCSAAFWSAVIAAACAQVTPASLSSAEDALTTEGLDLVVLVDVSRSMIQMPNSGTGNDPYRLRWDAVKLIVDLLTPADRILIQRFNDTIPASRTYLDGGRQPIAEGADFPGHFLRLNGDGRTVLAEKIARFNTTNEPQGMLDNGGTNIIEALKTVAERFIRKPAPGRETRVFLLTDGLDNDYGDGKYRTDAELRRALAFYAGENDRSKKIPIEIIGLRFPANEEGVLAREFSNRVATLTGGHFQEVPNGIKLVEIVREWIWKLKGYWPDARTYTPQQTGTIQFESMLVNGIVQLGILSYEVDPLKNPKETTAPPRRRLELSWRELKDKQVPMPAIRTGTQRRDGRGTVYDYFYFGKADDSAGSREVSPFVEFKTPVYLSLRVQVSDRMQELHVAKAPHEPLFALVCPGDNSKFYRHQTLHVRVRMTENWHFQSHQFTVTGELRGQDDGSQPTAISFQLDPQHPRDFVGHVSLRTLPHLSDPDYFSLKVIVKGTNGSNTALETHWTELPSRTIAVENNFELKHVGSIELTNEDPYGIALIETNQPDVPSECASVDDDVTLQAEFVPPRAMGNEVPLSTEHFRFAVIHGTDRVVLADVHEVVLKSGQAQLAVGLNPQKPPPVGASYEPGKLVISGNDGGLKAPLVVPVHLRLGREKVSIRPSPRQLKAESFPVKTQALAVAWDSQGTSKLSPGVMEVALQAVVPSSDLAQAAPFSAAELWVQSVGPPAEVPQRKQQLSVTLETPFEVYFQPRPQNGRLNPGKYEYRLLVSGDLIVANPVLLHLLIDVPEIVLDMPEKTVFTGPGRSCYVCFDSRLKGVPGQSTNIYLKSCESKSTHTFENTGGHGAARCELSVEHPTEREPLELKVTEGTEGGATIPLTIMVPPETPFGRYHCDFLIQGDHVADCQLRVHLVVNQLQWEQLAVAEDGQTLEWQSTREMRLLQFFKFDMKTTIRIRPGLETELTEDMIDVLPVGPFADSTGDEMRLPTCSKMLSGDKQSLLVHLHFPVVPNGHDWSYYSLKLHAASEALGVEDAQVTLHVRFWPADQILEH